jgi:hypothetical protein
MTPRRSDCRRVAPRFMIMSQRRRRVVMSCSRAPLASSGGLCDRELARRRPMCGNDSASNPSSGAFETCARALRWSIVRCDTEAPRRRANQKAWREAALEARTSASHAARPSSCSTRSCNTSVGLAAKEAAAKEVMSQGSPGGASVETHGPFADRRTSFESDVGDNACIEGAHFEDTRFESTDGDDDMRSGGILRSGGAQRVGWTFTLGTCPTDFPWFACLPRSVCTVTSVRGSLGSCQGEQQPWLTLSFFGAGAPTRARSASLQAQSRVLVPKLGRAPYIGAGAARQILDKGCLEGTASDAQFPRRRQRPFTETVRERHQPMSPPRKELGARWI